MAIIINEIIRKNFPSIDSDIISYLDSVFDNAKDDFESTEEIFESVGEILMDVCQGEKNEDEVRKICQQIFDQIVG